MKTRIYLAMAAAALAITLQAPPASAFLGLIGEDGHDCSKDWPKWKIVADPAGYALFKGVCSTFDASGTGSGEDLAPKGTPMRKGAGYDSDPSKGFGSDIPVTLPPDRRWRPDNSGPRIPSKGVAVTRQLPQPPAQINAFAPRRPVIK